MKSSSVNINSRKPIIESLVCNATVLEVNDRNVILFLNNKTVVAKVAFSCLVEPKINDEVICSLAENGLYYLLGIIERHEDVDMTLSFPENTTMQAKHGSINMVSNYSVNIIAGDKLNCYSKEAIHKSNEAIVDYKTMIVTGDTLQANFKTVRVLSNLINTMARTVIDKFKNYTRQTEDYDQVQAGQMQRDIKGLYTMGSKYTVMVSKKDTKIDGERIHMG